MFEQAPRHLAIRENMVEVGLILSKLIESFLQAVNASKPTESMCALGKLVAPITYAV